MMRYFEKAIFYGVLISASLAGAATLLYLLVGFRNLF